MAEGLRQIRVSPFLRSLTAHAALYNAAAQILVVNLVVLAVRERGLSAGAYGLALSAGGAGALAGALPGLRPAARLGYGRAFAASLALSTGTPLLPGHGTAYGVLLGLCQALAGVGLGSANVLSVTIRQLLIPRTALARSNGAYRAVTYGVLPVGAALGGTLGQALGSVTAVAVGAAGIALSALPMLTRDILALRDPRGAAGRPVRSSLEERQPS
jgi:hypothetical protein